jgi:outer membrane receptor protein involved in Fe transport
LGGALSPRLDVKYQSDTLVANQHSFEGNSILDAVTQPAFWKYDAYLNYRTDEGTWGVNFYVKNIEDTAQKTAKFPFGNPWISEPRTYGASVSYSF